MMRTLSHDENGVVSMVSVIFISILLSIISLAMVRLTATEVRLSTDYLLSTKAGYAAEAGVEDALYQMKKSGPFKQSNCSSSVDVEPNVTAYTCQLVDSESEEYIDKIEPSRVLQVDLSGGTFSQLKLEWYRKNIDENKSNYTEYTSRNPNNPPAHMLPVLRTELIRYPKGVISRPAIEQAVTYLTPRFTGGSSTTVANYSTFLDHTPKGRLISSRCTPPGTTQDGKYVCSFTLKGLNTAAYNYMLRVNTLYERAPISFRVQTEDASGIPVKQSNLMAKIDVTARATDVFRRVRYLVPLAPTADLPPFALGANNDICKDPVISRVVNPPQATKGGNDACTRTADPL